MYMKSDYMQVLMYFYFLILSYILVEILLSFILVLLHKYLTGYIDIKISTCIQGVVYTKKESVY